MIIKKPYAFLIRNFRLIHILLSALLIFVAYNSSSIYNFFNSYVRTGHYTYYPSLTSKFVNYYSFIIILFIIIIGLISYVLLKWKNKKTLYYVLLCATYLAVFLTYIYFFNVFREMEINTISMSAVRLYRDIALLMFLPQFIFIAFSVLRGIGFNIKKFNFSKDLQDLSINVKDNEEVEVILAKDTYKYMRGIRRVLRELRYFVLESKFALSIVSGILIVVLGFIIFLNRQVYNKTYEEYQNLYADAFNIRVLESYLTKVDYKSQIINKNKYYVILKLEIKNNNSTIESLNLEKYRLVINDSEYFPTISKINYFLDLGESYINQKILSGKGYVYLLTYEINKDETANKYTFRITNDVSLLKGEIESSVVNIRIYPKLIDEKKLVYEYNIKDSIDLSESTVKNSSVTINFSEIAKEFNEDYEYCVNDKCNKGIVNVKPEMIGKSSKYVLRLDTTYNIDKNEYILKYVSSINDFMNYFASVEYLIKGVEKTSSIQAIDSKYTNKNIAFVEVPEEIKDAEKINLIFTIRNINYKIKLK